MAVNAKLGIDVTAFKSGIADANAQLKSFDAQLKFAEARMKETGNAEDGLVTKTSALNGKLETQRKLLKQYEQALKDMKDHGVDPLSKDYQQLEAAMINTKTSMMETQSAIDGLSKSQEEAAETADQLTNSMNGLNKKVSLEQVRSGISSITSGLENAAKKAVDFGEKLFSVIMDSAAQADDISALATRLGLTDEQVQKMMYVADRFEAPVEQMAKTWKKVKVNMASDSDEIAAGFEKLGIATHEIVGGKYGDIKGAARDYMDVFWETGEALMKLTDASEQERLAQQLLGRSWDEMIPLFKAGREAYEAAVKDAPAAGEEAVENAASLNDRVKELESSWNTLKLEVIGAIAPALEEGAKALSGVLDSITKFLQTDDGKKLLEDLGTAVSNLFSDLGNISTEDVVNNVTGVLNGLTGGLEWLYDHWEDVKNALTWIVEGWAALKITGGVLDIVKVVSGLGDLLGIRAAGAAAGSAWGGAFTHAVLAAAPWLAGLITLLTPANTESNSLADAEGNLTEEGWYDFLRSKERASQGDIQDNVWYDYIMEAGEIVEEAARLWDDAAGIQALAKFAKSGNREQLAKDLEALGYVLREIEETNIPEGPTAYVTNDKSTAIHKDRRTGRELLRVQTPTPELEIVDVDINTLLEAQPNAAEELEKQVGELVIPVKLAVSGIMSGFNNLFNDIFYGGGTSGGKGFANGLSFVPNNGLYLLHKGEQVVPAREIASRSYSSNLYVESMYMNNNTDAEGLASAMAAAQRRTMSGYGS